MPKAQKPADLDGVRHSLAHLLAAAVLTKYPKAKLAIGPVIENGFYYDFLLPRPIAPEDLTELEKTMREWIKAGLVMKGRKVTPAEAKKIFKDQPFKLELIKEFSKDKKPLTIYSLGSGPKDKYFLPPSSKLSALSYFFSDLCRGGHVKNTKEINADGFKLDSIAGAYWKGDEKNPQLTRIYGLAFATRKELTAHLAMMEEAEKRDHRKLGKELDIFTFSEEVGMGLPLWLPNGTILRQELEKWAQETEIKWGYKHIATPHITKKDLFEISGHLPYYKDDLYSPINIEGEEYYLKPMNCPFAHMIFKSKPRSYRDLTLRLAEYGQVYRFERSGTLHGLLRARGFCQNDAHIYVKPEDSVTELVSVLEMHKYYYDRLGVKDWWVVLGVRDPKNLRAKYHGDDAMWKKAEKLTREALKKAGVKFKVEAGGAAHYGPKADIYIRSVIGKEYAIGTVQLDLYMPARFKLSYIDKDGKEKMPYVIHRAPLGSHERMIGFLLEHFAGAFPVWLSPVQAVVLPVSDKFEIYGAEVTAALRAAGIRAEISAASESLGKRIREAEMQKIPYILVVGEKEASAGTVAVRKLGVGDTGARKLKEFIAKIKSDIENRSL